MEQSRRKIAALFSIRQRHVHIPGVAWRVNILRLSSRFLGIPLDACARCTNTRLRTTHAISFPIAHVVHLSATGLLELRLLVSSLAVASTLASSLGTNTAYLFLNHNYGCSSRNYLPRSKRSVLRQYLVMPPELNLENMSDVYTGASNP